MNGEGGATRGDSVAVARSALLTAASRSRRELLPGIARAIRKVSHSESRLDRV